MSIPIPHDTKEVLTFEHKRRVYYLGTTEYRLSLKVMHTRRQGKVESITIHRIGDGSRPDAIIEASKEELDFLSAIFAFCCEGGVEGDTEGDTKGDTPPII